MIRHIVMWNYKESFTQEENLENAKKVKRDLEALADLDGVIELKVHINQMETSNTDVLLDSTYEDEKSFKAYKVNSGHLKAAEFIQEVLQNRVCFDWEVYA